MKAILLRLAVLGAVFLAGCVSQQVETPAPIPLSGKYIGARDHYTPGPK